MIVVRDHNRKESDRNKKKVINILYWGLVPLFDHRYGNEISGVGATAIYGHTYVHTISIINKYMIHVTHSSRILLLVHFLVMKGCSLKWSTYCQSLEGSANE